MNKHPVDAAENAGRPDKSDAAPAPNLVHNNRADANAQAGRDWVIPTILVLVTIVVISSTFFDEELAKLRAAADLSPGSAENRLLMHHSEAYRSETLTSAGVPTSVITAHEARPQEPAASNDTVEHGPQSPAAADPPFSTQTSTVAADIDLSGEAQQLPMSTERERRQESRASIYRRRVALRAEVQMRMQQDSRDMLRRMLEIQRDIRRARTDSLLRMNRNRPYSSTGYLM